MLEISRKEGQYFTIETTEGLIHIEIVKSWGPVTVGIDAPMHMSIKRDDIKKTFRIERKNDEHS